MIVTVQKNLRIFDTPGALYKAAAIFITNLAKKAVNTSGRFVWVLSGGHTPGELYELLSRPPFSSAMPWANTFIFWGDERCVPLADKRNNSHNARLALLDKVNIPLSNIYPMPVDLPPGDAATAYEKTINDFFGEAPPRFDLVLLGLGENGHTASLFPGTPVLTERSHLVKEVYVAEEEIFRITMTSTLINRSDNIIFLVKGKEKAGILKTILNPPYQPDKYPAQLIDPVKGTIYWFVDKDGAAYLR